MMATKFFSHTSRLVLKRAWILTVSAGLVLGASLSFTSCRPGKSASGVAVYPDDAGWATVTPAEKGVDLKVLAEIDSVMQAAHSNGILVIDGKVVKEWAYDRPIEEKIEVQSITKTMVSLLLGIALKEGKIAGIDDKVVDYYPAFEVGPHTKDITFKHLVTISSGIEAKKHGSRYLNPGNMPPGVDARYRRAGSRECGLSSSSSSKPNPDIV